LHRCRCRIALHPSLWMTNARARVPLHLMSKMQKGEPASSAATDPRHHRRSGPDRAVLTLNRKRSLSRTWQAQQPKIA